MLIGSKKAPIRDLIHWCKTADPKPHRLLLRRAGGHTYQNKAVIYDLLFKAASETMLTIAADPKHLGAKIGITAVLHT